MYSVLIPARLSSTRLPNKPLADLGGVPMVVRVAQRAAQSQAARVVVAADDASIQQACEAHGVPCILTRSDHPTGTDRLAQACRLLALSDDEVIVNVQGDEPLIEPALIDAVAALLSRHADCAIGTAAHPLSSVDDFVNPNVVKVALDGAGRALYFSRAPIPWWRDGWSPDQTGFPTLPDPAPLRHVGLYAYRVGFVTRFPDLPPAPLERLESLEQLRALWHGYRIAVHVSPGEPAPGVDTPEDLQRVRALLAGHGRPVLNPS